ncbi:MAG: class I SAM-dependent methyltransferase [Anaeromyxobacter sp.]
MDGAPHWSDGYYGELYLASVRDLLTPRLSALEAELIARVLSLGSTDRCLDLACGHGRHALQLAPRVREIVALDRSGPYLRLGQRAPAGRGPAPHWVQGDVRDLPLRSASLDAAWSWYAALFMFDDTSNLACLRELARVLRPGGRALVHHANPLALALHPRETAHRTLPGGGIVQEEAEFDPASGVERAHRRLILPGRPVLAATAELRYYSPAEWRPLAGAAGLRIVQITSTTDAGRTSCPDPGAEAPDLVAVLEKPT